MDTGWNESLGTYEMYYDGVLKAEVFFNANQVWAIRINNTIVKTYKTLKSAKNFVQNWLINSTFLDPDFDFNN